MAGSYNHVVENDGNLGSNEYVTDMLENGGDVFEAVEEMYGMIWYLAREFVNQQQFALIALGKDDPVARAELMKQMVARATAEYKEGLAASKEIHRLSPDTWREEE